MLLTYKKKKLCRWILAFINVYCVNDHCLPSATPKQMLKNLTQQKLTRVLSWSEVEFTIDWWFLLFPPCSPAQGLSLSRLLQPLIRLSNVLLQILWSTLSFMKWQNSYWFIMSQSWHLTMPLCHFNHTCLSDTGKPVFTWNEDVMVHCTEVFTCLLSAHPRHSPIYAEGMLMCTNRYTPTYSVLRPNQITLHGKLFCLNWLSIGTTIRIIIGIT